MIKKASSISQPPQSHADDDLVAIHEAGHAIAMFLLDVPIQAATIERDGDMLGHVVAISEHPDHRLTSATVERNAIYLHAADIATRLFCGEPSTNLSAVDHQMIHRYMYYAESDGSTQMAWCIYLWQRAYALMQWPAHRWLVAGLAAQLINHRTLTGDLQSWNALSLYSCRGAGKKTVAAIVDAAARTGVMLAPEWVLPRDIDPERWG